MSKLAVGGIASALVQHGAKALRDPTLPITLVEGSLEEEIPIAHDDSMFTVRGQANIAVFNSPSDADPAGLFGPPLAPVTPADDPSVAERVDDFRVRPPITFAADSAWLVYRTSADMKVTGSFEARDFGVASTGKANMSVIFHDYRCHKASESVLEALAGDILGARFVLCESDIRLLGEGDALAMEVTGTLSGSVSLEWSDVLTSHIGILSKFLKDGEDFGVDLRTSLRAQCAFSIRDHFLIVFTRVGEKEIALRISKSAREERTADVAAGVVVGFANDEQVEEVGKALLEGLLGMGLEQIEGLLKAPSLEALNEGDRQIVERLLARLRLEDAQERVAALAKRIEELKSETIDTVRKAAQEKVKFAIDFEYSRIETNDTVLEASIDLAGRQEQFSSFHRAALTLSFDSILKLGPAHGVTIHRFLRQETTKVKKSWGVSLSLGDVFAMGGKSWNVRERKLTTRRDHAHIASRYCFLAVNGYTGQWGDDTYEWKTTLAAKSRSWTDGMNPPAASLDYSLHLLMQYHEAVASGRDIGRLVDLGVLWGMVPVDGTGDARKRLAGTVKGRRDVEFSFHVTLDDSAFRLLLKLLAAGDARSFGFALGRAVPWSNESGRSDPRVRQALYGELWQEYLQDPGMSARTLANKAYATVKGYRRSGSAGRLSRLERDELAGLAGAERQMKHWWTVGELARINPGTQRRWSKMVRGAERLDQAISRGGSHEEVEAATDLMCKGWEHAFHLRALGAYLISTFRPHASLWTAVNRTLRVECPDGDEHVTLNLSSS